MFVTALVLSALIPGFYARNSASLMPLSAAAEAGAANPGQLTVQSRESGANHSYLFGCTQYTATINHCDIVSQSFNSTQENVVKNKIIQVPGHPNYVQSKYQKALKINADSLDLARIDNKGLYNSSKFTVYLSASVLNTENITGSLVSFVPEAGNAGWDLQALPTKSAEEAVIKFSIYNTQGQRESPGPVSIPSQQFVDIAASFDGGTIKVYADGVLKAQSKFDGTFAPSPGANAPLSLGSASWCSCSTVTAAYDEFRYYNRTLSDQEVSQLNTGQDSASGGQKNPFILGGLFQSKTPIAGLAGQWRFDSDLTDASANHNDAKYWTLAPNMVTMPDGRVLFTVKNSGDIDTIDGNGNLLSAPYATISPIFVGWEEGLLGITLDNKFATNHFVYAYYTYQDSNSGNIYARVVRFTDNNGHGIDMQTIYDRIPASHGFHTGGAMRFNPADDKLYVFVGDGTEKQKAQDLTVLNGKLLRLNRDGSIPSDNPFPGSPIFSYGHRNSFSLAFDPKGNGILAEAGADLYDYIDYLHSGGNYGWPTMKQPDASPENSTSSSFIKPIRSYFIPPTPTQAIFYTGDKFPELKNSFVFGSVVGNLFSVRIDNSTHRLVSEIRLNMHMYPYELLTSIAQLPSGDILVGGYNIYKLQQIDTSHPKPYTNIIQVNSTNVDVAGLHYDDKRIVVDIGRANGNNSLAIAFAPSMLSDKIPKIHYNSNTTIASDNKTDTTPPFSSHTMQTAGKQVVLVEFPNRYSSSDKMQIVIDASGSSITKTVPEFNGLLLSCLAAAGLLAAVLLARVTGVRGWFRPRNPV